MTSPEFSSPFDKYFEENPNLFKPLEEIKIPPVKEQPEPSGYKPTSDQERELLDIVKSHGEQAVYSLTWGRFNLFKALRQPDKTLIVYRKVLGTVLGKPLEADLAVGVNTGIVFPGQFDKAYNAIVAISREGQIDNTVTRLGIIYTELLSTREKAFLTTHYFPVDEIQTIIKPFLSKGPIN